MNAGRRLDPASLRLVAITDSLGDGVDGVVARAARMVAGGATMILLRLKDESPRTVVEVARRLLRAVPQVPLIVHDRADAALAAGAHGVHLGIDDLPASALRRVVPEGFLIGASVSDATHLDAVSDADYVAVGPVFARAAGSVALGLDGLSLLTERSAVPVLAIGGITAGNAASVLQRGAGGIAVLTDPLGEADPMRHVHALRAVLDATGR